jgi:hypothetical protein
MHGMYNLKVTLGVDRLLTGRFSVEFDFLFRFDQIRVLSAVQEEKQTS